MPMRITSLLVLIILLLVIKQSRAQDSMSVISKITNFPGKFFAKISSKSAELNKQIDKQTEKYLNKLIRQEAKLKNRLSKFDSGSAKKFFANNPEQQYAQWLQKIKSDSITGTGNKSMSGEYYPYVDSLQTSLSFLKQNPQLVNASKILPNDIQNSINQLRLLQAKMQDADEIKQYIQQRREQLKQYLSNYTHIPPGIMNTYNGYNKQLFYYKQQLSDYKEMLNDPDKMMKTALILLNKLPAFTNFMRSNSMLASLFNLPGTYNPSVVNQGMATRDQVIAAFQSQLGGSGPNMSSFVQQNVQSAQGQTAQLTDKLPGLGSGGGPDLDMPNFTPNSKKTKSFLQRLEYGTNLQTVHSTYYFPTTTDIALSLGYKLNDNNVIGIGASYKMGWGQDISNINISSQGIGFRSYADFKLKKSIFISGGFEYNYQQPFISVTELRDLQSWQKSGLIGLSKIISLKTKVFKKTKIQLLWDFLSYQQIPRGQPFKFRVGYSF
jgi:hypothetical protein